MLLLSGSIQSLVVETSRLLKLQRCSAGLLRAFLRLAGYAIAEIGGGEVAYAMGRTNEKTTKLEKTNKYEDEEETQTQNKKEEGEEEEEN